MPTRTATAPRNDGQDSAPPAPHGSHPASHASPAAGRVRYIMGVDTGGTCTDAVLMDAATRAVVASAKRPTTHHDLGRGMASAMSAALDASGLPPHAVDLISVSTTLATNAVVEGQGADVGLFLLGHAGRITVPCAVMDVIPGGHKLDGSEEAPLGLNRMVDSIRLMRDRVDAYAVCGMMSFINPAHELVAEKAIGMVDPKPVFCSHLASSRAGMRERAATAVLNARLLPVMRRFLDGVRTALDGLGIAAPVVVVRGNAATMPIPEALRNASATVASGPAAMTGYGAAFAAGRLPGGRNAPSPAPAPRPGAGAHRTAPDNAPPPVSPPVSPDAPPDASPDASPNTSPDALPDASQNAPQDALVVDVGGTTTDVTLLRRGRPVIQADGMVVGDWETHVEAVEMFTVGVGGDSLVRLDADGTLSVGPQRVVPLCMAGPLPNPATWLHPGGKARCLCPVPGHAPCETPPHGEAPATEQDATERAVLAHLHAHGPTPVGELTRLLRLPESSLERATDRLVRRQAVRVAGFTPTDALHVLGLLDLSGLPAPQDGTDMPGMMDTPDMTDMSNGDGQDAGGTRAALAGAKAMAALLASAAGQGHGQDGHDEQDGQDRQTGQDAEHHPRPLTPQDAARAVLAATSRRIEDAVVQHVARREVGGNFAAYLAQRHGHALLRVHVSLGVPMVGIGAASRHLLPAVAEALGTTVTFPDRYDVGNALGAALLALEGQGDTGASQQP